VTMSKSQLPASATNAESSPGWSSEDLQSNPHQAPDKAKRVREMFAAISHAYDLNNRLHSLGLDQRWRKNAVRLSNLKPTDEVLDVACGTGDLSLLYAQSKPHPTSVRGVDYTPEMLDLARDKQEKTNAKTHIKANSEANNVPLEFAHGDAMNLDLPDASVDVVSIAFGLRNVSDPAIAIGEFYRVLRPGGRLIVLEFSNPKFAPYRWLNAIYCQRIMPITASLIARDRSGAYRYLPKSVATFLTPEALAAMLSAQGFSSITAHTQSFGIATITRAVKQEEVPADL